MAKKKNQTANVPAPLDSPNTKASGSGMNAVDSKNFKSGAYSTFLTLIVLVAVLAVNLLASKINLQFDVSANSIFTLTSDTKDVCKNVKDPVTIYYIAQQGLENSTIKKIVDKYAKFDKVTVVQKDPVLYPNFTKQYTEDSLSSDSVIIVNNTTNAYKCIDYQDMLVYSDSSSSTTATGVDVEGQITAGIQNVEATNLPKLYYTGGHGETGLGDEIVAAIKKQNVDVENLNMYNTPDIPDDCDILVLNGPTYDLSADEVKKIEAYMNAGGNIIITLANTTEKMTNFDQLLSDYGMTEHTGVIVEDSDHCLGTYQTYLLPNITYHYAIQKTFSEGKTLLMPFSLGLTVNDNISSDLSVKPFLYTSDNAYLKKNTKADTVAKEDGDEDGPFDLAVFVEGASDSSKMGHMMVLSSSYFLADAILSTGQYGNAYMMTEAISYMTSGKAGLSIPTRSLVQQYVVTSNSAITFWAVITVGIIPLIIIGWGFIIWLKRRRR